MQLPNLLKHWEDLKNKIYHAVSEHEHWNVWIFFLHRITMFEHIINVNLDIRNVRSWSFTSPMTN